MTRYDDNQDIVYLPHSLTSTTTARPNPPTSQVYKPFIPRAEKHRVKYWTWADVDASGVRQIVVTMATSSGLPVGISTELKSLCVHSVYRRVYAYMYVNVARKCY